MAVHRTGFGAIDAATDVGEADVDCTIGFVTGLCACIGIGSVAFSTGVAVVGIVYCMVACWRDAC